jgi:hypothetical protein
MGKYSINWLGKEYPAIDIVIFAGTDNEQQVTISSTELDAILLEDMDGSIASNEAMKLDETIAYYIEPEEFDLTEEEIIKIVEASYN